MSKEMESVITRKGQITIPAPIREALSLREGDRVALVLEDQEVRLRRMPGVVERTAGIFRHEGPPSTAEELRRAAECALAEGHRRMSDDAASPPRGE